MEFDRLLEGSTVPAWHLTSTPDSPDTPLVAAAQWAPAVGDGETLFIPHGWWHHTRSLDDAVAVNFWWGGPLVAAFAFASAAFKRLRGIRRDEWG